MAPLIADIYRPDTEHWSHYSETILPRQFDAWLLDETGAVTPMQGADASPKQGAEHETYRSACA